MSHQPILLDSATPRWECPECGGTGRMNEETCPVCLGAKWIDSSIATRWLLDYMESCGSHSAEIELLRTDKPDPMILALCLGVCTAVKQSPA